MVAESTLRPFVSTSRLARGGVGVAAWVCLFLFLMVSAASAEELRFAFTGSTLTLHARHVPLQSVLQRIAGHGVRVFIDPDLNPPVSASFDNRQLQQALDSLLRSLDHVLVWESAPRLGGAGSRLAEIRVFRRGEEDRVQPLPRRSVLSIARNPADGSLYVRDEMLVRPKTDGDHAAFQRLLGESGAVVLEFFPETGYYRIRLPEGTDVPSLTRRMAAHGEVDVAEPNNAYPVAPPHRTAGGSGFGDAPSTLASREAKAPVAVLDTGLARHCLLEDWVTASLDALDPDQPLSDSLGHGTQMALIASGAVHPLGVHNESSLRTQVIAIRVFDDEGHTCDKVIMDSIRFALQNGARVLNLSWGSETRSRFLEEALDHAASKGLVVVASAGNAPTGKPVYPAAYSSVIGVGALDPDGKSWTESNYGSFVTLHAPGFATLPVGYKGDPGTYAGTSISSAFAAYVISDYLSRHPEATRQDVFTALNELRNPS